MKTKTLKALRRRNSSVGRQETEVARLTRELHEAQEQQAATSEVLEIIGHSTFDLQRVLESLLEKAVRLCGADRGFIYTKDGDVYRFAANYGHSAEFVEKIAKRYPITQDRGSASGRAILERRVVHIHDILADPEYRWAKDHHGEEEMHRTILAVPMLREDKIVGVIVIRRTRVEPFTEKQIALVSSFATQAVIAIENTRLLNELRESLEQQTATSEVLKVISSSLGDLQPVFDAMLVSATRLCEASYGMMWLRESNGQMRVAARHGNLPEAFCDQWPIGRVFRPSPSLPTARVFETRKPVHVVDLKEDRSYFDHDPLAVAGLEVAGIRTLISVPMLKDGEVVGTLNIYRQEVRPFTDKQIELVQNFASQAVIAIENARLLNELRQRTDDLSETLEQQTTTAEILGVISKSLSDAQPVFDAIVQSGVRLFSGATVSIALAEDGMVEAAAVADSDAARAEAWRKVFPFPLTREYMHSAAILDRKMLDVPDVENAPAELAVGAKNFLRSGQRAVTIVPLSGREAKQNFCLFGTHFYWYGADANRVCEHCSCRYGKRLRRTRRLLRKSHS